MALINCKECGKEISDKATNCPNCGAPINDDTITKEISAGKKVAIFCIVALVIVIICVFIFEYFIPSHTYTTIENGVYKQEFRLFN